jgi:hypothetical protein
MEFMECGAAARASFPRFAGSEANAVTFEEFHAAADFAGLSPCRDGRSLRGRVAS